MVVFWTDKEDCGSSSPVYYIEIIVPIQYLIDVHATGAVINYRSINQPANQLTNPPANQLTN